MDLTGQNEIITNSIINIYPNPVLNELIIEKPGNNEKLNFEFTNILGKVVYKGSLTKKTVVETNRLAAAIYIIKFEDGKTFKFNKINRE